MMKKKQKKEIVLLFVALIIMILVSEVTYKVAVYSVYSKVEKDLYEDYKTECDKLVEDIDSSAKVINTIQESVSTHEKRLFESMTLYFLSLQEEKKNLNSDQKVLLKTFKKSFPSSSEYKENREQSMVSVYALLNVFPELLENKLISEAYDALNVEMSKLTDEMEQYNSLIETYSDKVSRLNKTKFVQDREYLRIENKYEKLYFD